MPFFQNLRYEEGVWSPVLSFQTPPTTPFTMDIVDAKYTRVGRKVTVNAFMRTDSVNITGAAGFALVSGLPFAASGYYPALVTSTAGWSSHPSEGYVDSGSTNILLQNRTAPNVAASFLATSAVTTGVVADQNAMMIQATYFV